MELLVFKSKDEYLRIRDDDVDLVALAKASVYPISMESDVSELYDTLKEKYSNVVIRKLTIQEEEYVG